jgi:hypothetical protein
MRCKVSKPARPTRCSLTYNYIVLRQFVLKSLLGSILDKLTFAVNL